MLKGLFFSSDNKDRYWLTDTTEWRYKRSVPSYKYLWQTDWRLSIDLQEVLANKFKTPDSDLKTDKSFLKQNYETYPSLILENKKISLFMYRRKIPGNTRNVWEECFHSTRLSLAKNVEHHLQTNEVWVRNIRDMVLAGGGRSGRRNITLTAP